MKKTVKDSINREVFRRFIGCSTMLLVLAGSSNGIVEAVEPTSGVVQVVDTSNTVTALTYPGYSLTNNDTTSILYAKSTGTSTVLTVNGDVWADNIQSTAVMHDNFATAIYATSTGANTATVKVNGNVVYNSFGTAYADIYTDSVGSTIDITGTVTANTDSRYGAIHANSGTIKMGAADLRLTDVLGANDNSIAISVKNGGTVDSAGEIKINNMSKFGKGIWIRQSGLVKASSLEITSNGNGIISEGDSVNNGSSAVHVSGLIKVVQNSVNTSSSTAVAANYKGEIKAGSMHITVNNAGSNDIALEASSGGTIDCAGAVKIVVNKDAGDTGYVTGIRGGGKITLGSADIRMDSQNATAIFAVSDTTKVNGLTDIVLTGQNARGVRAQGSTAKVELEDLNVTTTANMSRAIFANVGGRIDARNVVINGTGQQAFGVNTQGAGTSVTLTDVRANMSGIASRGLYAQDGSSITANYVDIATSGSNSGALAATNASAVVTVNGGRLSSSDSGSAVLRLYNVTDAGVNNPVINITNVQADGISGSRFIRSDGFSTVNAMNSVVTGNVMANALASGGLLTFNMDNTELTGTIATDGTAKVDLTMDNNSLWNITGAAVNSVNVLDNRNGVIDMSSHSGGTYETLKVNDLRGTGTYILDTDLGSQLRGDKLNITTSAAGTNIIKVKDISLVTGEVTGVKNLLLVDDASGNAVFVGSGLNSGGLWDVTPTIERGTNALDASGNPVGTANQWFLTKLSKKVNNDTQVLVDAAEGSYALWRNTNDSLRQRLGELRFRTDQLDGDGIWARYKGGKFSGSGFDSNYNMYQLGYDKADNAKSTYGFALERGSGSNNYSIGSGKDKLWAGSIYGTWHGANGGYTDVVARFGQFDTDIKSYGDYPDKANAKSHAYSLSVEYGKTIELDEKSGTYVEPQAQLIAGRMSSSSYTTDRDNEVYLGGVNSYIGRLGFVLGQKNIKGGDIYFKANLLHEFGGDRDIYMHAANGEFLSMNEDYSDTWFELGLGGNIRLGKASHFYGDIERSFGAEIQKKWQINAGVRFEF